MKQSRWLKSAVNGLSWTLAIFLVVNGAALFVKEDQWGLDAAYARCAERGWPKTALGIRTRTSSRGLFGQTAEITFRSGDPARRRTIRLVLRRPLYLMDWRVEQYSEAKDPN